MSGEGLTLSGNAARSDGETFAAWTLRATDEELS